MAAIKCLVFCCSTSVSFCTHGAVHILPQLLAVGVFIIAETLASHVVVRFAVIAPSYADHHHHARVCCDPSLIGSMYILLYNHVRAQDDLAHALHRDGVYVESSQTGGSGCVVASVGLPSSAGPSVFRNHYPFGQQMMMLVPGVALGGWAVAQDETLTCVMSISVHEHTKFVVSNARWRF